MSDTLQKSIPPNRLGGYQAGYGPTPPAGAGSTLKTGIIGAGVGGSVIFTGGGGSCFGVGVAGGGGGGAGSISNSSYSYDAAMSIDSAVVSITKPLVVNGRDVMQELDELRDSVLLLTRHVDMEAKYPKLKELKDAYQAQLEKYKTFDALKESK
jgi:hypothetical protein